MKKKEKKEEKKKKSFDRQKKKKKKKKNLNYHCVLASQQCTMLSQMFLWRQQSKAP